MSDNSEGKPAGKTGRSMDPAAKIELWKLRSSEDSADAEPGEEVDGDSLLGPQEGATVGDDGLVHPAQDVPADEAGDDLTVVRVIEVIERAGSPFVEAVAVEVVAGECAMFDEES